MCLELQKERTFASSVLKVVHFVYSWIASYCCKQFIFHYLQLIFSKNGLFLLHLSRELQSIQYFPLKLEATKHHNSHIQIFSNALQNSNKIYKLTLHCPVNCRLAKTYSAFRIKISTSELTDSILSYGTTSINDTYHFCCLYRIIFHQNYDLVIINACKLAKTYSAFQTKISAFEPSKTIMDSSLSYGTISINGTHLSLLFVQPFCPYWK